MKDSRRGLLSLSENGLIGPCRQGSECRASTTSAALLEKTVLHPISRRPEPLDELQKEQRKIVAKRKVIQRLPPPSLQVSIALVRHLGMQRQMLPPLR